MIDRDCHPNERNYGPLLARTHRGSLWLGGSPLESEECIENIVFIILSYLKVVIFIQGQFFH